MPLGLYACFAGFLFVVIAVNISSHMMERPEIPAWQPAVWEFSSYTAILILAPAVYYGYRRFHWRRLGLVRFLAMQAVLCTLFSAVHIALMVGIRQVAYLAAHSHYDFSHGHMWLEVIYEARKDAITFLVICGFAWVYERLQPEPSAGLPERIEVKGDGRTHYLTPEDIITVEAAGNYVELHLTGHAKPLLLRGTLTDYEKRVSGHGIVRVHRSRLVNRYHLREVAPTPSGDLRLTLSDGRHIAASRRYRAALDL